MSKTLKKLFFLTTAMAGVASFAISDAHAAGFQLKEQGAEMQGLSFAGATARAKDLSTIFFNPAGMTRFTENETQLNVSLIRPSAELSIDSVTSVPVIGTPTAADGNGGDAGELAAVPSLYALWVPEDRPDWRFGVGVNTPFGLSTSYDDGWAGRYYALDSSLTTVSVSPSLAYKVNDRLSIGGAAKIDYIKARLTKAANVAAATSTPGAPDGRVKLVGDDVSVGYKISALYEFDERTRIGVNYDSRVKHDLGGTISIQNISPALAATPTFRTAQAEAEVDLPDVFAIGLYHELNDEWAVMADFAWTNWSLFKTLQVNESATGLERENVPQEYNDTRFYALGFEHKYDSENTFQFGVAYDEGAVKDEYRTFRIPDTDRYWVSAGWLYELDNRMSIAAGYTHIFAKDASIVEDSDPSAGDITGEFDSHVDILAVNLSYKF